MKMTTSPLMRAQLSRKRREFLSFWSPTRGTRHWNSSIAPDTIQRGSDVPIISPTALNPYMQLTRLRSREPAQPPTAVVQGIDALVAGRSVTSMREHWRGMSASVMLRTQDLQRSLLRKRDEFESKDARWRRIRGLGKRDQPGQGPALIYGPAETLSHALHRTLPNLAVAQSVLGQVRAALPPGITGYEPKSVLDFGSGVGSATLAAARVWPHTLRGGDLVCVESSRSMRQACEHMLREAGLPGAVFRRSLDEVQRVAPGRRFDLVLCHYSLAELTSDGERARAAERLWDLVEDGGVLVVLEKGSRWGFHCVRMVRDGLLARGRALEQLARQRDVDADPLERASKERESEQHRGKGDLGEQGQQVDAVDFSEPELEPAWEAPPGEGESAERVPIDGMEGRREAAAAAVQRAKEAERTLAGALERGPVELPGSAPISRSDATRQRGVESLVGMPRVRLPELPLTEVGPSGAMEKFRQQTIASQGGSQPRWLQARALQSSGGSRQGRAGSSQLPTHLEGLVRRLSRPRLAPWEQARVKAGDLPPTGVAVVGPCPHAMACPMHPKSWCHFAQAAFNHRLATSRKNQGKRLPTTQEKFSWVALRRTSPSTQGHLPPQQHAGYQEAVVAAELSERWDDHRQLEGHSSKQLRIPQRSLDMQEATGTSQEAVLTAALSSGSADLEIQSEILPDEKAFGTSPMQDRLSEPMPSPETGGEFLTRHSTGLENAVDVLLEPSTWWLRNRSAAGRIAAMTGASTNWSLSRAQLSGGARPEGAIEPRQGNQQEKRDDFSAQRLMRLLEESETSESDADNSDSDTYEHPPTLADLVSGGMDGADPAFPDIPDDRDNAGLTSSSSWQQQALSMETMMRLERERHLVHDTMQADFFRRGNSLEPGWSTIGSLGDSLIADDSIDTQGVSADGTIDYVRLAQQRMNQGQRSAGGAGSNHASASTLGSALEQGQAQDWVLAQMGSRGSRQGLAMQPDQLGKALHGLGDMGADVLYELQRQGVAVKRQKFVEGEGWVDVPYTNDDSDQQFGSDSYQERDSGHPSDDADSRMILDVGESDVESHVGEDESRFVSPSNPRIPAGWARSKQAMEEAERTSIALSRLVAAAIRDELPGAGQFCRIVRMPLKRGGHTVLDLCTPWGTLERWVPSKRKLRESFPGAYRAARRAGWGGLWPAWIARRDDRSDASMRRAQSRERRSGKGSVRVLAMDGEAVREGVEVRAHAGEHEAYTAVSKDNSQREADVQYRRRSRDRSGFGDDEDGGGRGEGESTAGLAEQELDFGDMYDEYDEGPSNEVRRRRKASRVDGGRAGPVTSADRRRDVDAESDGGFQGYTQEGHQAGAGAKAGAGMRSDAGSSPDDGQWHSMHSGYASQDDIDSLGRSGRSRDGGPAATGAADRTLHETRRVRREVREEREVREDTDTTTNGTSSLVPSSSDLTRSDDSQPAPRRRRVLPTRGMVFAPRQAAAPKRSNVRVVGADGLPLDGRDEAIEVMRRPSDATDPLEFSEAAIAAELPPEMRRYREAFATVGEARRAAEQQSMDMANPDVRRTLRSQRGEARQAKAIQEERKRRGGNSNGTAGGLRGRQQRKGKK